MLRKGFCPTLPYSERAPATIRKGLPRAAIFGKGGRRRGPAARAWVGGAERYSHHRARTNSSSNM